jgi:hypothetical protein
MKISLQGLQELQALRNEYELLTNQEVYWALTVAIDVAIGLPREHVQDDIARLRRATVRSLRRAQ